MDLIEKIAARRRERESRALQAPRPSKETSHQKGHSDTKIFSNNKNEIDHVYQAFLYQAAADTLKHQLKESKNSTHTCRLEKEIEYFKWHVKLKQKAYPEDFSDTIKLRSAKALLLSREGEHDLKSLLKKTGQPHQKSPKKPSKDKKSKPFIVRFITYIAWALFFVFLAFSPNFSWWHLLFAAIAMLLLNS